MSRVHYHNIKIMPYSYCTEVCKYGCSKLLNAQKYVLVETVVVILIGDKAVSHLQDIIEENKKKAQ